MHGKTIWVITLSEIWKLSVCHIQLVWLREDPMSIPPCNILYSHQGHFTKCIKLFALDLGIRKETPAYSLCIIIIDVHPCTLWMETYWMAIVDGSLYFWRFSRVSRPENPFKTWVVGNIFNIKDELFHSFTMMYFFSPTTLV